MRPRLLMLGFVVALLAGCGASEATRKARAYCAGAEVGHTTALNTLVLLGQPDDRFTKTIGLAPTLFFRYGTVSFAYDWTGFYDSSRLAVMEGC